MTGAFSLPRRSEAPQLNTAWNLTWTFLLLAIPAAQEGRAQAPTSLACDPAAVFVENRGQWNEDVFFTARGGGWRAAVERRGWRMALADGSGQACVVALRAVEGSAVEVQGLEPGTSLSNYFLGDRQGIGARSFARVRCAEIVPGVDLVLRSVAEQLEYDLELAPGADLDAFVFEIEGATLEEIASDGSLVMRTPLGVLRQSPPRAFEIDAAGESHACASAFVRHDATHFGFSLGARPAASRYVIDPVLVWSTYVGGGTWQSVRAIAPAGPGKTVIAGATESADFPTTAGVFDASHNGAADVFVLELDDLGRIRWSTFLGGLEQDEARSLAVDAAGLITLAGHTRSLNFPATAGAFDISLGGILDGFVARLSPGGTQLVWCTYLGGTKNEELNALALDASGDVTVAGWTNSNNFPVTPGTVGQQLAQGSTSDGCVSRLSANGSALVWSTYLGGTSSDSIEALVPIPGAVLVGGTTASPDFPTTVGGWLGGEDGFVVRLTQGATQMPMSTTFGTSADERIHSLASDGVGAIFFAGRTNGAALPVTAGVFGPLHGGLDDGFIARLDFSGTLVACTYVGGSDNDEILVLARYKDGELLATGWTASADFRTTPGANDAKLNSGSAVVACDAFVIRVAENLSELQYSTFFGAGSDDRAFAMSAIDSDTVLLAGETDSYFFPATPGAHRTSRGILATMEGFASKVNLLRHPIPYGAGQQNSYGSTTTLKWIGFPSVSENSFQFVVDSGVANQPAVVFVGYQPWNQPFFGGRLFVRPPLKRVGALALDFVGYGEVPFALNPLWVGKSIFAQAWCRDPWSSFGCAVSGGLEVEVYP